MIASYFEEAKSFRDELPMLSKGASFLFDLFVDVPDYPGVISEVTVILRGGDQFDQYPDHGDTGRHIRSSGHQLPNVQDRDKADEMPDK